jgi:hypothetical protein
VPFVDSAGAALAVYLVSLVAVAWITGRSRLREPLAALGLLVSRWACVTEFDGVALIAAWSALMVVGFAIWRGLATLPHESPSVLGRVGRVRLTSDLVLPGVAILSGLFAALHALWLELPIADFGEVVPPEVPFTDSGAVAAMILVVAVVVSGAVLGWTLARRVSALMGGAIVAYAIPFEVYAWAVAVLWAGLGGLALVSARVDRAGRSAFLVAAGVMVGGAALVAIAIVAPPSRLVVGSSVVDPVVALQSAAALGAVALGLLALARFGKSEPWARWVWIASGVTVVYLVSVAVVDAIGTQVGGPVLTDELRTQGQATLKGLFGSDEQTRGLANLLTEAVYGGVWSRAGLARADRMLCTIAALATGPRHRVTGSCRRGRPTCGQSFSTA